MHYVFFFILLFNFDILADPLSTNGFDRWNCTYKKNIFKKAFRETAFLHALSSSAIMFSIAKACSDGRLQNCRCAQQDDMISAGQQWKWGGCADNIIQAKKLTRNFLQLQQYGDGPTNILNYDSIIGLKTVDGSEMKVCKCHGVSASCVMKTCWKSLIPFSKIAEKLKNSYHNAVAHSPKNAIEQTIKKINKSPYKLLYFTHSSSFCQTTAGRRCRDTENCATLCCGRGFVSSEIVVQKHCKCRWQRCCYDVICDTCSDNQTVYTCK